MLETSVTPRPIHTIVIYPRPHADTICAIWLLRTFGEQHFPGVGAATIDYWNQVPAGKSADDWEAEGTLLIDLGGGKFDHHHDTHDAKSDCASTLIAKYLGLDQDPALKKLLAYVKRDDLEGRGTVSKDTIDRAFGLSAIIMNFNRDYPEYPDFVIDTVSRIYHAHYHEEYKRKVLMPQEWQDLQRVGKATRFNVMTAQRPLHVVMIETDSKAMIGFLRAVKSVQADVVVQKTSSGHVNIVTRQVAPRLDLRATIAVIRREEVAAKQMSLGNVPQETWEKPARMSGVEEWYFDTAANTLQNGGADTSGITPTRLSLIKLHDVLQKTLPQSLPDVHQFQPQSSRHISLNELPPRPAQQNRHR